MSSPKLKSDPSRTVLVITVGFLMIYLITEWNGWLIISFFIGIAGILSGFLARKIEWAWMKLTWVLSLIVPNILLTLVFYFILTPIALLSKLFAKEDPLILKNNRNSMFKKHNKEFGPKSFENPW